MKLSQYAGHPYNWRPDMSDFRDQLYSPEVATLPQQVDLRPTCPPVYDQGQLGSCTANAISAAVAFMHRKAALAAFDHPSRLFIYYNERSMEGTVDEDAGAFIRDGIKSVNKLGVCDESAWPYDISRFRDQPPPPDYVSAQPNKITSYRRIGGHRSRLACLAAGFPFVFGFSVYESFESAEVAMGKPVPMPQPGERCLGGHAVLAVGYDEPTQMYLVRNSWGDGWGISGYFWMPYAYLDSPRLADDFWTVRK